MTSWRLFAACSVVLFASPAPAQPIDREALVHRHTITLDEFHDDAPLAVGNGEFAFNFDVTGLQTFPSDAPGAVPLATMAQWAWHAFPESRGVAYEEALRDYSVHGRDISYATDRQSTAAQTLRANPHRINLGRIALRLTFAEGRQATRDDIQSPTQTLDLWTGEATSRFTFDGEPVTVRTVAHPTFDAIAVSVESPLVASGRAAIELRFSYPSGEWGPGLDDWKAPQRHTTTLATGQGGKRVARTLDETHYTVAVDTDAAVSTQETPHTIRLSSKTPRLDAVLRFNAGQEIPDDQLTAKQVCQASAEHWKAFWRRGGAIDLSASNDPRWRELERRIVLSQHLTAIHCAGSLPPQETGLVCNSWFGKHHLEMHWWHAAHFALWNRIDLLERSLGWYKEILPAARRIAERQGYAGVRWPKMTGPDGVSSPSDVGELLIWQQPHPIWFAELAYDADPSPATLDRYGPIVDATADFMADYAWYDEDRDQYVLGPLLVAAQESYSGLRGEVLNPTFEVAYWRWALRVAADWRERRGLPERPRWRAVADKIAPPTIRDGVYTAIETAPYTTREDHPSMLAALGVLPNVGLIDRGVMDRTLSDVQRDWDWPSTWGWDCPMAAMTAARLGRPNDAIDLLLRDTPKNGYLVNGHCRQADRLPVYLPANGGLLYAAAMMAAGWEDADPTVDAPGFPADGSWTVRHEGLRQAK
ncbi:hypothetical protein Pla108_10850 [Botrimarina colliarenosi]|uniref:Glycosyl hydrolase family 65 central catalytic domain protein n=1 Tax=Botrimarina colliarenosi TaxID=2528001 RepID=A0A5C6AL63_9BACT|nr:hypothetical protein [Botrimarina colliarenosi]TWU00141.1 hypothetical protein Pla108_10850 [Botrimarina colliarenosi]